MKLPFTEEQFLQNFARYNQAIWPIQILALLVCVGLVVWSLGKAGAPARVVLVSLSGLWLWNGVAYYWLSFSTINPAAKGFAVLFVAQAIVFAVLAVKAGGFFRAASDSKSWLGSVFVLYAVVVYPLLGWLSGHVYPSMPVLGVAPCPTTIFTLGLLLMCRPVLSRWVYAIPLVWVVIGSSAAVVLGMREDYGMTVAGLLTVLALIPWPTVWRRGSAVRAA